MKSVISYAKENGYMTAGGTDVCTQSPWNRNELAQSPEESFEDPYFPHHYFSEIACDETLWPIHENLYDNPRGPYGIKHRCFF